MGSCSRFKSTTCLISFLGLLKGEGDLLLRFDPKASLDIDFRCVIFYWPLNISSSTKYGPSSGTILAFLLALYWSMPTVDNFRACGILTWLCFESTPEFVLATVDYELRCSDIYFFISLDLFKVSAVFFC